MGFPIDKKRWEKGIYWTMPWTLIDGCTPARPDQECKECWAASWSHRMAKNPNVAERFEGLTNENSEFTGIVKFRGDRLDIPKRKKKPQTFSIWTEPFHPAITDTQVLAMFNVMFDNPHHVYLVLTKRAKRMRDFVLHYFGGELPKHIGLGITVGCREAVHDLAYLVEVNPGFRFVSMEPLLEYVDMAIYLSRHVCADCGFICFHHNRPLDKKQNRVCPACYSPYCDGERERKYALIDWIILGAESKGGRLGRNMDPAHASDVILDAREFDIPVFVKQMGWNGKLVKDMNQWPIRFCQREVPKGFIDDPR